jgi:YD repeat-containing protein
VLDLRIAHDRVGSSADPSAPNRSSGGIGGSGIVIISYVTPTGGGDTTYPIFSNYSDNNGTLLNSGIGYFNVTVLNTNGTVWLNINGTNLTATNLTDGIFNVSYNFTQGKVYTYTWWAYGNGTSKNLNNSGLRSYTVNSSVTDTCTSPVSGNWAITCADNCTWNANQVIPANVTITGNGVLTLNKNFTFSNLGSYMFINKGCQLNINKGGGFG